LSKGINKTRDTEIARWRKPQRGMRGIEIKVELLTETEDVSIFIQCTPRRKKIRHGRPGNGYHVILETKLGFRKRFARLRKPAASQSVDHLQILQR
jgi:hypothetical protein